MPAAKKTNQAAQAAPVDDCSPAAAGTATAAGADIMHLCWETAGPRPQDLVTNGLLQQAFSAGRDVVLWHEERPAVIADLVRLPVLGICSDLPELLVSARRAS